MKSDCFVKSYVMGYCRIWMTFVAKLDKLKILKRFPWDHFAREEVTQVDNKLVCCSHQLDTWPLLESNILWLGCYGWVKFVIALISFQNTAISANYLLIKYIQWWRGTIRQEGFATSNGNSKSHFNIPSKAWPGWTK